MLESLFVSLVVGMWALALIIGVSPETGARIGLWLQGYRRDAEPPAPPPLPDTDDKEVGNNIDRFV